MKNLHLLAPDIPLDFLFLELTLKRKPGVCIIASISPFFSIYNWDSVDVRIIKQAQGDTSAPKSTAFQRPNNNPPLI
jgi:hypothetical protein